MKEAGINTDDFIGLLGDDSPVLPPLREMKNGMNGTPVPAVLAEDAEWQNDPVPVKLDKIRAAFLNGKTAQEVQDAASLMAIGDWLELVAKIAPKNVQIQGSISFTHMLEEFGPINKEQYRLPGKVVEAEYKEITE